MLRAWSGLVKGPSLYPSLVLLRLFFSWHKCNIGKTIECDKKNKKKIIKHDWKNEEQMREKKKRRKNKCRYNKNRENLPYRHAIRSSLLIMQLVVSQNEILAYSGATI